MNADDRVANDVGLYYRLAQFGEPYDWAGADLVCDWFRRNMASTVMSCRSSTLPTRRILVASATDTWAGCDTDFASNSRPTLAEARRIGSSSVRFDLTPPRRS